MSDQWKAMFKVWRDEDAEPEEITVAFEIELPDDVVLAQGDSVPWPTRTW